jgi:hypothetical protein
MKPLLAILHAQIVLDVLGTYVPLDRLIGTTLIEHQVIEGHDVLLVPLDILHASSFLNTARASP